MPSSKQVVVIAGVALLAYFIVAMIQQKAMPIPLIGAQLPR